MSDSDETTYSAVRTVLGTTRRDSCWHLTDEVDVLTVLGRSVFDLRSVETTGGEVVEISVNCLFGMVDFIVPDGTMVVLDGTSFLAGTRSDVTDDGEHDGPRVEITALTILGRTRVFSPGSQATELDETDVPEAVEPETAEVDAPAVAESVEVVDPVALTADGSFGHEEPVDTATDADDLVEAGTV